MRILITGGAGYIGSTIGSAALDAGHDVVVIDDLSEGRAEFCAGRTFYQGDIGDAELLDRVEGAEGALFALGFSDFRVRVFHGAARLQFPRAQWAEAAGRREALRRVLKPWFDIILLDTEDRG